MAVSLALAGRCTDFPGSPIGVYLPIGVVFRCVVRSLSACMIF